MDLSLAFDILAKDRASKELENIGDSADKAGGKLEGLASRGSSAMDKLGSVVKVGALGVGAAGGAALASGFFEALDQDAVKDQAFAGLAISPREAERLGDVAGDLYAGAWGDSFQQVADSVAIVKNELGSGLGADALEDLTANALDFEKVMGIAVPESVGAAGILIRNNLVKDGEEAFDLLTATMQRIPQSAREEVFAATQEYSQFFGALGVSGEEAFTVIADAAQRGGNFGVDKVGDALKELTIRATDMSESSKDAFEAAGLDAQKMSWRFLQGGDTARGALEDLVSGLQGIEGDVARSNAAIALFGTPLEDLGTSEIPAFLDALSGMDEGMGNIEGSADRMGDKLNNNLKTRIETFRRQGLQRLTNFMEDVVLPGFDKIAPAVEAGFGKASDIVGGFVGALTGDGDKLAGVAVEIGKLFGEEEDSAFVGRIISGLERLSDVGGKVIGFYQGAFEELRSLFAENGEEIGAIVGGLSDTIGSGVDAILAIIETFIRIAEELWGRFGEDVLRYLEGSFDNALQLIQGVLTTIQGVFDVFAGIFTGDWARVWDGLSGIVEGAWGVIRALVEQALNILNTALQVGLEVIAATWDWAWNAAATLVSDVFDHIVGFVGELPGRARDALSAAWELYYGFWREVFTRAKDFVGGRIGDVVGFVAGLPARARDGLASAWDTFYGFWTTKADEVKNYIRDRVDDIVGFFTGLGGRIREGVAGAFDGIWGAFRAAINKIIRGWNGLEFTLPSVDTRIPGVGKIGGWTLGTPDIPELHQGGTVTPFGIRPLDPDELFARLQMDETVLPAGFRLPAGGATYNVTVNAPSEALRRPSDLTRELMSLDFLLHGASA